MPSKDEERYQSNLARIGRQLALSEALLQTHPLVQDKLKILQTALHYFTLQTQWQSAGSLARLLLTFKTALRAQEVGESASGFIGPSLGRMQKAVAQLMQTTLKPSERQLTELLLTFTQVVTLVMVYLATQTLGNWKGLFPQNDPGAAKKAGLLLRELGLTFILGSHLVEKTFRLVAQGLGVSEQSQKGISAIGLLYVLILLAMIHEEDDQNNEELLEILLPFMKPTLDSLDQAVQQAQSQAIMEEENASLALSQLQLMRQVLENADLKGLKQAIESSFQALELPYQEVKKDLRKLIELCSQLNSSFRNIFYQKELSVTTMTQAA
ncbi:hypothetical protein [Candidatus Protochlamydia phocaeensis]|uniref:hypothetical protein n=1 Tax=Candidatus Protochlamydia phocaeensis TaxID=1414722 RepID=UPI000838E5D9|nr:hypothetical protein [Candidatus Protochlamydia phocaeensis]